MGNGNSIMKINFESMKKIISNNYDVYLIINTLSIEKQDCLIKSTLTINQEIEYINKYIKTNKDVKIVIYGENCSDNNVINKYNQLYKLGFKNIYVYIGGLFEWLLLQEVYGIENFPTSSLELDILKYK